MGSLATCLAKIGASFSAEDRAALMMAASEFRRQGMEPAAAERAALAQHADALARRLADSEQYHAAGKVQMTPQEIDAATPKDPAKAQPGAMEDSAVQQIAAQYPDLRVMLDGMESPVPLAEFMATVRAEADDMLADMPLLQMAAECAILNGV